MLDLEVIDKNGIHVIDSKLLHKKLEVKSYHSDWIRRRVENYGFKRNQDFYLKMSKSTGGRKGKSYLLTLDMAKELCMIENNDTGKKARRYFIEIEKQFRISEAVRMAGIETRKTLTEKIEESGENDRMHGHAYSTYTKLVYSVCGLSEEYRSWKKYENEGAFRDWLKPDDLKRVELAESLIKPMLELDKQYAEIKETIKPLFEVKEVN